MTRRLLTGVKAGDRANATVHEDGAVVIMPTTPVVDADEARVRAERVIRGNSELFKRLA